MLLLGAAVAAIAQEQPPAPAAQAVAADAPASGVSVGADYLIGPDDVIQVYVWRNPELTITVPVRPDGRISSPLVKDIVAAGKTPTELANDIEQVLTEYIRSPEVSVVVTAARSVFSQIKVIGEVGAPKSVSYREGLKVLDVVLEAGGLGQFAAGNRAYILRTEGGQERRIPVRLNDLLRRGDTDHNLSMRSGDVLVVPQSRF